MKASKSGVLLAAVASICCIGPLLFILLGLGSLGAGAVIGKYHWYFIAAGIALLAFSWGSYLKEKKRCNLKGCQMVNKKITLITLVLSTLIVFLFVSLNVYTYAIQKDYRQEKSETAAAGRETIIIPVEGMSCFACELAVSSALKKIGGVVSAKASAKEGKARVKYDPSKIKIKQLIEAVNRTGYRARLP